MASALAHCSFVAACVTAMAFALLAATPSGAQPLDPRFYDSACPAALPTIKRIVEEAVAVEPRMGASLLRLHFHDCFVNGCDGSILLDDTPFFTGEKNAAPNVNSVLGFEVIDRIKAAVRQRRLQGQRRLLRRHRRRRRPGLRRREGQSWPSFRSFRWTCGILDGHQAELPRPRDACRPVPPSRWRPDDFDDDRRDPHRYDRRRNINARGRPADDRPRAFQLPRDQQRPPNSSGRHHAAHTDVEGHQAKRGRSGPRSPSHYRTRQPPRRDDEGWERRRSRSPARRHRQLSPPSREDASANEVVRHQTHGATVLPSEGPKPAPQSNQQDPLVDYLADKYQGTRQLEFCRSQLQSDPMLLELVTSTPGEEQQHLSSLLALPHHAPDAAPVPQAWHGQAAAPDGTLASTTPAVGTGLRASMPAHSMCISSALNTAVGGGHQSDEVPPGQDMGQLAKRVGSKVGDVTAYTSSPSAHVDQASGSEDAQDFTTSTFKSLPPAILPTPTTQQAVPRKRSSSAEPSRRSARQAKQQTIIPVAHRATIRLIRQLDLAGADDLIGDDILKAYAALYKKPLSTKAISAIRAITNLANNTITTAAAALSQEELAAQAGEA